MQGDISLLLSSPLINQILDILNDAFFFFLLGELRQDIDLIFVGLLANLRNHITLIVFTFHVHE